MSEITRSLQHFGDRYARRLFSEDELVVWRQEGVSAAAAADLAERFAGKEAAIKILAPGERALDWRSVEVRRGRRAGCSLRLSGAAAALAHEAGVGPISLSVSSAAGLAMAVAVASSGAAAFSGAAASCGAVLAGDGGYDNGRTEMDGGK